MLTAHQWQDYSRTVHYRACLEKGLLRRDQVAPNTFSRIVDMYEMLKPDADGCLKMEMSSSAEINDNTPASYLPPNTNYDRDSLEALFGALAALWRHERLGLHFTAPGPGARKTNGPTSSG